MKHLLRILVILSITALAACQNLITTQEAPVYVPPTLAATPTPLEIPTATSPAPTPTPSCTNNLLFQADLTYPDGTNVEPGEIMDKRWRVHNSGSCNWEPGYTMRLIAGPDLGAPPEQPLFPAVSGSNPSIRIVYTAPNTPGIYRSAWQAYSPADTPFGDPIFIEIEVE